MAGETRERYEHIYIALNPHESVRGAHVNIVTEMLDGEGKWRTIDQRAMGLAISDENDMYGKLEEIVGEATAAIVVERENLRNEKSFLTEELESVKGERDTAKTLVDKLKTGGDQLAQAYAAAMDELTDLRKQVTGETKGQAA